MMTTGYVLFSCTYLKGQAVPFCVPSQAVDLFTYPTAAACLAEVAKRGGRFGELRASLAQVPLARNALRLLA
jgi:hypothetical protein